MNEIYHMIETEQSGADRKLRSVLEDLTASCSRYLSISKGAGSAPGLGKTKLDKERRKMCLKEIVRLFYIEVFFYRSSVIDPRVFIFRKGLVKTLAF